MESGPLLEHHGFTGPFLKRPRCSWDRLTSSRVVVHSLHVQCHAAPRAVQKNASSTSWAVGVGNDPRCRWRGELSAPNGHWSLKVVLAHDLPWGERRVKLCDVDEAGFPEGPTHNLLPHTAAAQLQVVPGVHSSASAISDS